MEALSQSLQPYKELVGQTASIVTIGQFFSGVFICRDIYRKGSTTGIPSTPFIGGLVIGALMLKHGLLLNDAAMLQVNVAAIFLNILYTTFYYLYSQNKYEDVLKPMAIGAAIVAVFLGYTELEDPKNLEYRYGLILTVLMMMLIGSPLLKLKEILNKKDASSIPFALTLSGTLVTFLWFFYGIILLNYFMIIQNLLAFVLCSVQLILLFLFPGGEGGQSIQKKKL